ncbi:Phosphoglycerate mutase domain protein [Seminavis robusta]|uniref:Phosphoglycerate mutase domain protein n=1 Tax=Seminavis robusta TaxID=568900 RepID=A0A9N8E7N7_9STRA|nr:Phosphoglycerate mutase domain protein [Seminavis robusta]|eukprot:Sro710_g190990.1 Phosphoglycerate mutase domain protein (257) ;mRNA; f:9450-10220
MCSPTHRLRVILVRHGESQNNLYSEISIKAFQENRVCDPSISDRGQQQAQSTADYLGKGGNQILGGIDEIHVSPMKRTLQTAAPIAAALPTVPVQVFTDIHEISGVYDGTVGKPGMTRSQMQSGFPTYTLPESLTEKGWYTLDSPESYSQGQQRCRKVWERLCAMADGLTQDRCILMVVHGDFTDSLLQAAFGVMQQPPNNNSNANSEKIWVFPTWNTAITALDIRSGDKRPTLLFHNSIAHLPPELVKFDKLGRC